MLATGTMLGCLHGSDRTEWGSMSATAVLPLGAQEWSWSVEVFISAWQHIRVERSLFCGLSFLAVPRSVTPGNVCAIRLWLDWCNANESARCKGTEAMAMALARAIINCIKRAINLRGLHLH